MENPRTYTYDQQGRVVGGGQMATRYVPDLTSRSRPAPAAARPVSRSTDLYEKDCEYRAGARFDGGGRLLEIAAHHILQADRTLQEAAADGASPAALAAIEQLGLTYSTSAGHLLHNYVTRPREQW